MRMNYQNITFYEIDETFRQQTNSHSATQFTDITKWRKLVSNYPDNIFCCISILNNNEMDHACQAYVIDIIADVVEKNIGNINLQLVVQQLSSFSPSLINFRTTISQIAGIIGKIAVFVYIKDRQLIINPIEEQGALPPFEWEKYKAFLIGMEKYKNSQIVEFFQENDFYRFFKFSINMMRVQPQESISLLFLCLNFNNSDDKVNLPITFTVEFQDPNLFQVLFEAILSNNPQFTNDSLRIISLIIRTFAYITPEISPKIDQNIHMYCNQLMQQPQFFQNDTNILSFINLIRSFSINLTPPRIFFIEDLLKFCINLLETNYRIAFLILPEATSLFLKAKDTYIEKTSELYQHLTMLFMMFVERTLIALEQSSITIGFDLLSDYSQTKKILSNLNIISEIQANEVAKYLSNTIPTILQNQINEVINYQICFLLLVSRKLLKNRFLYETENYYPVLINVLFQFFLFTNDKINQFLISNRHESLTMERFIILYLKSFISTYFKPKLKSYITCGYIPMPQIESFDCIDSVVIFIFKRYWFDIQNEIDFGSKKALIKFVDIDETLRLIGASDVIPSLLEHYMEYPNKNIIYYIVSKIISTSDEAMNLYLSSIESNFGNITDPTSLERLFKIISGLFKSFECSDKWSKLYKYIDLKYNELFLTVSMSNEWKYLLRLIQELLHSAPSTNPFKSYKQHSFHLFRSIMTYLINITSNIKMNIEPLNVDESIFETSLGFSEPEDSKPISLYESRYIGDDKKEFTVNFSQTFQIGNKIESKLWPLLSLVISIATNLLKSPFPNFGVLELYNDQCIFVFFDELIQTIYKTPKLSLLAFPQLILDLSTFLMFMTEKFPNVLINRPHYWEFVLSFTKIIFASHSLDALNINCRTLSLLLNSFSKAEEIKQLRIHFILAFNLALTKKECEDAASFFVGFLRIDPEFVKEIARIIANALEGEKKINFQSNFDCLINGISQQNELQDVIEIFKMFQSQIVYSDIQLCCIPELANAFEI